MNTKQLYYVSKYACQEAFLESQLSSSGSNQAKVMEKLEKDAGYIKNMQLTVKGMVVLYLALMVITPIFAFDHIQQALAQGINQSWTLLIGSIFFAVFFVMQSILLIIFEVFFSSGIIAGDGINWLSTMPLRKEELRKVLFFSYLRGLDWPIGAMVFILPIGVAIITQNIVSILIAIMLSVLNILFTIGLLTIFGQKITRIFRAESMNDKKTTIIRVAVLISYIFLLMAAILSMQFLPELLQPVFYNTPLEYTDTLNILLSLIPFPTNGAILLSLTAVNPTNRNVLILTSLAGLTFFAVFIRLTLRKSLQIMDNILKIQEVKSDSGIKITTNDVKIIKPKNAVEAFFNKEKNNASRDIQLIMWFIIPIVYALLATFMFFDNGTYFISQFYMLLSVLFIVIGISRTDSDGVTITASLPMRTRDQALAKFRWFYYIVIPSYLVPIPIIWYIQPELGLSNMLITIFYIPLGPIMGILLFCLKIRLFGKMKYKYVIDELNKEYMVLKWFLLGIIMFALGIGMSIVTGVTLETGGLTYYIPTFLGIDIGFAIFAYSIFNYMFPRNPSNH
jgi:hypothetical protein